MKYEHAAEPATSWLKAPDLTEMKLKKKTDDKEFKILNTMLRASPSVSQSVRSYWTTLECGVGREIRGTRQEMIQERAEIVAF